MKNFDKKYNLENRLFIISINLGEFPVQSIVFIKNKSDFLLNGILKGESINSGKFIGKFIAEDQIEIFFQFFENSSSFVFSGRLWGFVCGNPCEKLTMFLNWHYKKYDKNLGSIACVEL